jgi:hypothetical protein
VGVTVQSFRRWRNVLIAGAVLALVLLTCDRRGPVERATSSQDRDIVSAVVNVDIATAHRVIQERFGLERSERDVRNHPHFGSLVSSGPPSTATMSLGSEPNPALEGYVKLDASAREYDFYLERADDAWWLSEYHIKGVPIPFSTRFIIHLEPAGGGATTLEVIEYFPLVWTHNAFRLHRHGGGVGAITERVATTTRDRANMLNYLIYMLDPDADGMYVGSLPPWFQLD